MCVCRESVRCAAVRCTARFINVFHVQLFDKVTSSSLLLLRPHDSVASLQRHVFQENDKNCLKNDLLDYRF